MKNDITEIANRIAKPKETELFKFGDVKVCKFPLKFNDGKVVNNLNYYEQMELLKILSKKWNVKVRHLTLEENFKLVHSKEGKEYMKNVLTPHWIYTGEFVKRGDDISNFKKSCDKWCYECYDEKGNSAIRCYWYSGEQGLLAFTGRPLYRYDVGVLSICFENQLKIKEKPEHMRNKPEKEGKSSVTMTSNEDRIRINAIPNDALPSESLPKECNCEHRKELSDIVMPFPVTKAGWYCPVHGWVDYKKSDKPEIEAQSSEVLEASLTSKRNRLATSQNGKASSESILTILRDIIAHGNWKYFLEVYGKLESEKDAQKNQGMEVRSVAVADVGHTPKSPTTTPTEKASSENSGLKRWTRREISDIEKGVERIKSSPENIPKNQGYEEVVRCSKSIHLAVENFYNEIFIKADDVEKVLAEEIGKWHPYTTEFRKGCLRSLEDLRKKLLVKRNGNG